MTRRHADHFTYPADKARQGRIVLDTRRKRLIFAGGLALLVLAMLLMPFFFAAS